MIKAMSATMSRFPNSPFICFFRAFLLNYGIICRRELKDAESFLDPTGRRQPAIWARDKNT
jgi:hypothetical protein